MYFFLVNFENGKLSTFVKKDIYFGRLKNKIDNQLSGKLIVNGQSYEGPLICNQDKNDNLVDNYICVRNKTTNKASLYLVYKHKIIFHNNYVFILDANYTN